ncbi:CYTH domain-containing protein [Entomomonas asaccharolytica]|uniref:CYTH domain-containing protein n=1 Tax=Entomomonas asaccharolytica TaxID=2785331 RepID=A0A974NF14_9GAMM|nr:CYTH domain-containing protein [Entomomonas asaccharolytica]QQP85394.1 CYTH domain-containing protein [Entomomonas asaccharolytica]
MSNQNSLKEIEIKLYATEQTLAQIYQHPIFSQFSKVSWQQKELFNQYIDTADYALTAAKVALRVRKDGEQYIQTLKAKGHSIGGFSERDEFDWLIDKPELDLSLLDNKHWPKSLAQLDKSQLHPIFATDFTRNYALFTWQKEKEQAEIEVAIDQGLVKANQKQEPINELELELRNGSTAVMLDFAIELAKLFPLVPSDTSKAERGYRLINPDNYQFSVAKQPVSTNPYQAIHYYLAMSQRLLEGYIWQPSRTRLVSWLEHLQQLNSLLMQLKIDSLVTQLSVIVDDWKSMITSSDEQLMEKVKQELNKTRWGVFSLSASHWLLNHS